MSVLRGKADIGSIGFTIIFDEPEVAVGADFEQIEWPPNSAALELGPRRIRSRRIILEKHIGRFGSLI